ncbi:MAG TPA: hypothetical protein VFO10_26285 [Oligoflexus sp.]|uniref:hypothetical protein n=1 Tax=Oligoflexus sp. TaxID=1971216 RepID=UPI002D800341|nr:hypothetical protein [Oligoflexus sp.]HET9240801.1 hypothetical protein [Oligoflexus sp.]
MKIQTLALLLGPVMLIACGDSGSDESAVASRQKKLVVVCDGAVFNDADPFGKRVTLTATGTKTYKAGSFDVNKEKDELRKVATALRQQCNGGYTIVNTSICDQIDVVNTDISFHTLFHSVNGFTYKGSYSCGLKEKN